MAKPTRNPGVTNLKTFGRVHRDEPHYNVYEVRLYPKRGKIRADSLGDWCGQRYLQSRSRTGAAYYRINTYKHSDGNRYVDSVFFRKMTDDDKITLKLLFGDFGNEKVIRTGKLRRPKLKKDERVALDAVINAFYKDVSARREQRIAETGKAV